jgi:hypothetical protein
MEGDGGEKKISIESFGVKVTISAYSEEDFLEIKEILAMGLGNCFSLVEKEERSDLYFRLEGNGKRALFLNGEKLYEGPPDMVMDVLDSKLRLEIALKADKTFLHSGVVGWKGKAIVFPGFSYKGKTTLTAEFVRLGAEYYSDEYAVLDEEGLVHPFPKFLSVRGITDNLRQFNVSAEGIGGRIGKIPIPIGLVLITEYEPGARWSPEFLSKAEGILNLISHTVPFSEKPAKTLRILEKALGDSKIVKQKRGEATEFARKVLDLLESR